MSNDKLPSEGYWLTGAQKPGRPQNLCVPNISHAAPNFSDFGFVGSSLKEVLSNLTTKFSCKRKYMYYPVLKPGFTEQLCTIKIHEIDNTI